MNYRISRVKVVTALIGFVVGRGHMGKNSIEKQTNCRLKFPKSSQKKEAELGILLVFNQFLFIKSVQKSFMGNFSFWKTELSSLVITSNDRHRIVTGSSPNIPTPHCRPWLMILTSSTSMFNNNIEIMDGLMVDEL